MFHIQIPSINAASIFTAACLAVVTSCATASTFTLRQSAAQFELGPGLSSELVTSPLPVNESRTNSFQSGTVAASASASARADITGLGISLDVVNASGSVSASIFEGVRFSTPRASRPAPPQNLSFALVGSIDGEIDAVGFFGSRPPGLANRVGAATFNTLDGRAAARQAALGPGSQGVFFERLTNGLFSQSFNVTPTSPPAVPLSIPTPIVLQEPNCALVTCYPPGTAIAGFPPVYYTDFGLGIVLAARIADELGATGSIEAFNTLDIEGLVALDGDGEVVPGYFFTESGANLTIPEYAPQLERRVVPLPASGLLFIGGIVLLAACARRSAA